MQQTRSNKKVANSLVAMSSAAVLAVYSAGYARTKTAANKLAYERSFEREAPPEKPARDGESPPVAPDPPVVAPPPARAARSIPKPVETVTKTTASPSAPANVPTPSAGAVTTPPPATTVAATPVAASTITANESPAVAPAQPDVPAAPAPPPPPVWKDGKYAAWGTCRHGDIQATVVIEGGKIISAEITDCQTRYSCDIIETLPGKVIDRQKNKFTIIGGATESAYAYYGAVYWALDQASK